MDKFQSIMRVDGGRDIWSTVIVDGRTYTNPVYLRAYYRQVRAGAPMDGNQVGRMLDLLQDRDCAAKAREAFMALGWDGAVPVVRTYATVAQSGSSVSYYSDLAGDVSHHANRVRGYVCGGPGERI